MLRFNLVFTAIAALSTVPSLSFAADSPTCNATQLAGIRTDFPKAAQARGEHGNVTLKVAIGLDGRARGTEVTQSSGYPALDKAAADSVMQYWQFAVAHCAANSLPEDALVIVQFQQAPRYTVTGTVNRRRASAQAQSSCAAHETVDGQIVTCLANTSLAATNPSQPALANRAEDLRQRK